MSAIKLFRRSLLSMNVCRSVSLQSQTVAQKSCRPISSVILNCNQKKDRNVMKTPGLNTRVMSSEAKFEVMNIQDEADYEKRVICSSKPVIVDFHATWCGPCKILAPRLESIVSKKGNKVNMAKVDIDENGDIAMEYGVRSVPTVIGIKNGKRVAQFIGVIDDDQVEKFVEKLIIS